MVGAMALPRPRAARSTLPHHDLCIFCEGAVATRFAGSTLRGASPMRRIWRNVGWQLCEASPGAKATGLKVPSPLKGLLRVGFGIMCGGGVDNVARGLVPRYPAPRLGTSPSATWYLANSARVLVGHGAIN